MKIGEKIAKLRIQAKMSQEELGEILEVSRQSVSKWEMDQALPQLDKVIQLCEFFKISTDQLLYDKIDIVEKFCFLDGKDTPFGVRTVKYLEYETVTLQRSREEAERLAYFELSQRLAEAAGESVMLKKTVIPVVGENSFVLMCSVVMIEDIAEIRELQVEEN